MNHNQQLLHSLYSHASGKYLKYKQRLDKAVQNGRFYKLNKRKQSSLVSRLKKLFERLKSLQVQLRIAGAGAAFALTISIANPSSAQNTTGPFVRNDPANPFVAPVFIDKPHPAVVDIDGDGDLDVFVGNVDGGIQFFRNDSPANSVTRFTEVTGTANPFNGVFKGLHAAPAFADVDGDFDYDMLLGVNYPHVDPPDGPALSSYSPTFFFRNTGSKTNPIFVGETGLSNPFNGIYGSKYGPSIPTFIDMDGDGDVVNLFIGSSSSLQSAGKFFLNQGTLTSPHFVSYPHGLNYLSMGNASLTFADIDNDGDLDVFAGSTNNYIRLFRQDIENQIYGVYDSQNPFLNFSFGNYTSPVAADFDKDGDVDFIVASDPDNPFWGPDNSNLHYVENKGNFVLEDKAGLNITPFDGVDVGGEAVPVFADLDGDNDLDALIGSKYSDPDLFVYTNVNGKYKAEPDNPIADILNGLGFTSDLIPVFADIDNDTDKDLFICSNNEIFFFRKTGGNFVNETTPFPTVNNTNANEISLAFLDVDKDGDLDAFVGNYRSGQPDVVYFKNNGTASVPDFTPTTPPDPFNAPTLFEKEVNLSAVDLDNDGDTDLVVTHTYYNGWYGDSDASEVLFFENKNDGTFVEASAPILKELTPRSFTSFVDFDSDGDLDAFVGNGYDLNFEQNGKVFYYENTNPPPITTLNASTGSSVGGTPSAIDPTLTLADSDSDFIVRALVSIQSFQAGNEVLAFTPQAGITGTFNSTTGVLTLSGKATIATYQSVLRAVTHNFTGTVPGGRKSESGKTQNITRTISFQVFDSDFTTPLIRTRAINVAAPNTAPIIVPEPVTAEAGADLTINVIPLITDSDGNFTPSTSTVTIVQQPISGASASLVFVSASVVNLMVDYTGINFSGSDQIQIQACDDLGACTTSTITIQVNASEIIVFNAFSPNGGDNINSFFNIRHIEVVSPENKVTIYNRWGDAIFEITNYNNTTRKFEGQSDSGKELPTGTYFYKIEATGKTLTGYLSLKR